MYFDASLDPYKIEFLRPDELADGSTVVLTYDYRYPDRFAWSGVRGRVSYDSGRTWEPEEYVLGERENYPGCIATDDGGMITICPYRKKPRPHPGRALAAPASGRPLSGTTWRE